MSCKWWGWRCWISQYLLAAHLDLLHRVVGVACTTVLVAELALLKASRADAIGTAQHTPALAALCALRIWQDKVAGYASPVAVAVVAHKGCARGAVEVAAALALAITTGGGVSTAVRHTHALRHAIAVSAGGLHCVGVLHTCLCESCQSVDWAGGRWWGRCLCCCWWRWR